MLQIRSEEIQILIKDYTNRENPVIKDIRSPLALKLADKKIKHKTIH